MIDLGTRIKELRLSCNYKSYEFAELLNITTVFLSYLENGTRKPSLPLIERVCTALGITLAEFFNMDNSSIAPELQQLLNNAKNLSTTQINLLNEFINTLK